MLDVSSGARVYRLAWSLSAVPLPAADLYYFLRRGLCPGAGCNANVFGINGIVLGMCYRLGVVGLRRARLGGRMYIRRVGIAGPTVITPSLHLNLLSSLVSIKDIYCSRCTPPLSSLSWLLCLPPSLAWRTLVVCPSTLVPSLSVLRSTSRRARLSMLVG